MQPAPRKATVAEKHVVSSPGAKDQSSSSSETYQPTFKLTAQRTTIQAVSGVCAILLSLIIALTVTQPNWLATIILSSIFAGGFAAIFDLIGGTAEFKYKNIITATGATAIFFGFMLLLKREFFNINMEDSMLILPIQIMFV